MSHHRRRTDVTLVGTGKIGSALGATLLSRGHSMTVWNRTATRTTTLQELGATATDSLPVAVAASPLTVVCLMDYDAVRTSLSSLAVREALRGKTLVVHSTGSPAEAREMAAWAEACQIDYLEGTVGCYPFQFGTDQASTFYAGSHEVFQRHISLFESVGGAVTYLGSDVGHPAVLAQTELVFFYAAVFAFLQTVGMAEAEGMSATEVLQHLKRRWWMTEETLAGIAARIGDRRYTHPESSLSTDALISRGLLAECHRTGLDTSLLDLFVDRLTHAALHYGDSDIAAAYEFITKSTTA